MRGSSPRMTTERIKSTGNRYSFEASRDSTMK
jgi:hypothetical protein